MGQIVMTIVFAAIGQVLFRSWAWGIVLGWGLIVGAVLLIGFNPEIIQ